MNRESQVQLPVSPEVLEINTFINIYGWLGSIGLTESQDKLKTAIDAAIDRLVSTNAKTDPTQPNQGNTNG